MHNERLTLKEHINKQPRNEYNKIIAKLAVSINRSLDAVHKYLSGQVTPPQEIASAINKHLKTDLDFDRAHIEYLERKLKKDRAKLNPKPSRTAAHA